MHNLTRFSEYSKQMTAAEATEEALDVARPNKEESQDENEDSENQDCSIMEREKVTLLPRLMPQYDYCETWLLSYPAITNIFAI